MDKLSEQINHYKPLLRQILASAETKYFFTSIVHHQLLCKKGQLAEMNRNYVLEIIYRFHAASLITLRRNLVWIESVESSRQNSSLFAFCSSLRGLIESSADSFYSLRYAPQNLSTYFKLIDGCIKKEETQKIHLFKELEDWGLHFLEAGKYEDKRLKEEHFKAKPTWEYLKAIDSEGALKPVYPLYQKLCQITHPSRETTYLFFHDSTDGSWSVSDIDQERQIIEIIESHDTEYEEVFQKSFNTALILLWIIDLFSIDGLKCPQIRAIDFTSIPEFIKVKKNLSSNHQVQPTRFPRG
jgi:hypothetical protein